jgi:hypothetical protein
MTLEAQFFIRWNLALKKIESNISKFHICDMTLEAQIFNIC